LKAAVAALTLLACCCSGAGREAAPPIVVAAAASLAGALGDAALAFRAERPAARVEISSGGSGLLVQQILRGAPVDVFVSASPVEVERLREAGAIVEETRTRIASNRLVVVVPRGRRAPRDADALAGGGFGVVAVGNPRTAPLGRYTRQALERLGLAERLEPKLVFGENARQTLDYVARGEADAGIVYASDLSLAPVETAFALPENLHDPIRYEGVVLEQAADREAAGRFLAFLGSPRAREALSRHGLAP